MLWRNDSHLIDIMNYFAEANPIWVVGELEPAHANYGTRYHGDGGRDAVARTSRECLLGL